MAYEVYSLDSGSIIPHRSIRIHTIVQDDEDREAYARNYDLFHTDIEQVNYPSGFIDRADFFHPDLNQSGGLAFDHNPVIDAMRSSNKYSVDQSANELSNRMSMFASTSGPKPQEDIVNQLIEMFNQTNVIVKAFCMVHDSFQEYDFIRVRLRLVGDRSQNQYSNVMANEVVGLIFGDLDDLANHCDIIIEHKCLGLQRISDLHPVFMAIGDRDVASIGKKIILPTTFTTSPRYLMQNYQNAMAICRHFGYPDLFITFTCNAKWPEILEALKLIEGQKPQDRPDIIAWVFKIRLKLFMDELIKKNTLALLLQLEFSHKRRSPSDVDNIISAEILDPNTIPLAHKAVLEFMIHGPYGPIKPNVLCMSKLKC
ncbi:hypothetical protein PTKIN_Ptkin06aG0065300 [Pterospermum kingtungense]